MGTESNPILYWGLRNGISKHSSFFLTISFLKMFGCEREGPVMVASGEQRVKLRYMSACVCVCVLMGAT